MANSTSKERNHWVDVAKGLLIFLVVWGHLDYIAETYAGTSAFAYKAETNFMLLPYYMPAFFILSGMCSNFDVPLGKFLVKNAKLLIVPSILLGMFVSRWVMLFCDEGLRWDNCLPDNFIHVIYKGGDWFLSALFISKCLYFMMHSRKVKAYQAFMLSVVLMLVGIVMYNRHYLNVWHYQHALIALPFLVSGCWLRDHQNVIKHPLVIVVGVLGLLYAYAHSYPFLNAGPHITWQESSLFLLLSLGGSLLLFRLSMFISPSKCMEYVGRHTLTIYLLHTSIMVPLIELSLISGTVGGTLFVRVLAGVSIVLISVAICLAADKFIDKHLAFLKGRL